MGWAGIGAWKRGWAGRLGKVLGNFDGWGCLGKVLTRLHARLLGGLGWIGAWELPWVDA